MRDVFPANHFLVVSAEFDIDHGSAVREFYPPAEYLLEYKEKLADLMIPESIHRRTSQDWTCFDVVSNNTDTISSHRTSEYKFSGFSVVQTTHHPSLPRGATVQAIAVIFPTSDCAASFGSWFRLLEPESTPRVVLTTALQKLIQDTIKDDCSDVSTSLILKQLHQNLAMHLQNNHSFGLKRLPFTESSPATLSFLKVSALLSNFGAETMIIYNALLMGARVLFLGSDHQVTAAGDVCQHVLATIPLLYPPFDISSCLYPHIFPYATLTNLEFISISGFVAGVTNPMFKLKEDWWDVLCDLESKRILVSSKAPQRMKEMLSASLHGRDFAFICHVLSRKPVASCTDHLIGHETWIHSQFQRYTLNVLDSVYFGEKKNMCQQRINALIQTRKYLKLQELHRLLPSNEQEIHQLARLVRTGLVNNEGLLGDLLGRILFSSTLSTEKDWLAFVSLIGSAKLNWIAQGLFHRSLKIQQQTAKVFQRMASFQALSENIMTLNPFLLTAYNRVLALRT